MADGAINIDLILDDQTDKTWTDFKSKAEQQGKKVTRPLRSRLVMNH